MKKIRDAATGRYISQEEAETKDKSTWILEKEFDKDAFLKEIFNELKLRVNKTIPIKDNRFTNINEELVLSLCEIKEVFIEFGADFEED